MFWQNVNIEEEEEEEDDVVSSCVVSRRLTLEQLNNRFFNSTTTKNEEEEEGNMHLMRERLENDGYASESSFDGHRDYLTTTERVICGTTGTVRGMKNRVRAGIATFIHHSIINEPNQKDYGRSERGRVVVYTTTNGIVRQTFQRCLRVNTILATLLINFEERNVFLRKSYLVELNQRMSNVINSNEESQRYIHRQQLPSDRTKRRFSNGSDVSDGGEDDVDVGLDLVPQVFVDGKHLGGAERVDTLNEIGLLKKILQPYKRLNANLVCEMCGNYRLLLCRYCNGSKKSRHNLFTEIGLQVPLKCTSCDENGLVTCHYCQK
ncbi:hypothetical protein CHUAL_010501 [Chamberlinius hualienensis]